MAFLRTDDINFYHPVDDKTENTQSQLWAGSGLFVAGALPSSGPLSFSADLSDNLSVLPEQYFMGPAGSGAPRLSVVRLTETKHVCVYMPVTGAPEDLYGRVIEYSNGVATSGDIFIISTGTAYSTYVNSFDAARISDSGLLVTRAAHDGNSYADILSVDGVTLSSISSTEYDGDFMYENDLEVMTPYVDGSSSGIYMVTGKSLSDNKCYMRALAVSGSTVDSGSRVVIDGLVHSRYLAVAPFNTDDFITFFAPTGDDIGRYIQGSIDETTTTMGASGSVLTDVLIESPIARNLETDRVVMYGKISDDDDKVFQYYLTGGSASGTPDSGIFIRHSDRRDMNVLNSNNLIVATCKNTFDMYTQILRLSATSGTLGEEYATDEVSVIQIIPFDENSFVIYDNDIATDRGVLQVFTASGASHIYASDQGVYPSMEDADRLTLAFWTKNPTTLGSEWYIDAGYNLGLTSGAIVFGDGDATWNDSGISDLMASVNDGLQHFVVLDFVNTGGSNWGLSTSVNGSGWVDQGEQDAGTASILGDSGSTPSIMASGTDNYDSWVDEVVVWGGSGISQLDSTELDNLYELKNTYEDVMPNYTSYFGIAVTGSCNLFVEGIGPVTDSLDLILTGHYSYDGQTRKLYFSDRDTENIRRCNLDGSDIEVLVAGVPEPRDLTVDEINGKVYWLDSSADIIQRCDLDGENLETVVTGLDNPCGIAFDADNELLYWTDAAAYKIQRSNYDGTEVTDLITTGISGVQGICLDVASGHMYFVDNIYDTIFRANLDGSNLTTIIDTNLDLPVGLELDIANRKMYWTDFGNDTIKRANMDGTSIETLIPSGTLNTPHGLTLDLQEGHMYWVDLGTDKLQKANLDGSNVEDIITAGLVYPDGIELGVYDNDIVNLFTPGHEVITASGSLYIAGQTAYSEMTLYIFGDTSVAWTYQGRSAEEFVKTADYSPQLVGSVSGSPSIVTIQVWNITGGVNAELSLASSGCYSIGSTGRWGWSTSHLPAMDTDRQQFFYRMIGNTGGASDGEFKIDIPESIRWFHPSSQSEFLL